MPRQPVFHESRNTRHESRLFSPKPPENHSRPDPRVLGFHETRDTKHESRLFFLRSRAVRLLLCALAVALWAPGQVFPPLQSESFDDAADGGLSLGPPRSLEEDSVKTGVTIFHGSEVRYEVIDGLAVTGGDMIIGTAEEVAAWSAPAGPSKSSPDGRPSGPKLAPVTDDRLWPKGIIRYVIDRGLPEEQKQRIREAIEVWNTRTVISLVEGRRGFDYLRFSNRSTRCLANVGRKIGRPGSFGGGASFIYARHCSYVGLLHAIGHAVGLYHEHQRADRGRYVTLPLENVVREFLWRNMDLLPGTRPYNYRSLMHDYPPTLETLSGPPVTMESIPPGIPIGGYAELTPGDIAGVAQLYGMPPRETVISTNPPNLDIVVDGELVSTPASFQWAAGSEHVLEALSLQSGGGDTRYLFGRWSDEGARRHTIRASPESTWFEANYIVQHRVTTRVLPPGAGSVTVRPGSPDGFYARNTRISVEAVPAPDSDYRFEYWSPRFWWGWSENPIPASRDSRVQSPRSYTAFFHDGPLFLIDSNVDRIAVYLDGAWMRAPVAVRPRSGSTIIRTDKLQSLPEDDGRRRFRFRSWSDGGDISHAIEMPPEGGSLTAEMTTEYHLEVYNRVTSYGDVDITRNSGHGYYPSGTEVVLTAVPVRDDTFPVSLLQWRGSDSLFEPVHTLVMNSGREVEVQFTTKDKIQPGVRTPLTLSSYPTTSRIYTGADSRFVQVPREATELKVSFRSLSLSRDHDLLLLLRHGRTVPIASGETVTNTREDVIGRADYALAFPDRVGSYTITRESDPPLRAGSYFLVPATFNQKRFLNGWLTVEITRAAVAPPKPVADLRALLIVAPYGGDAPASPLRVANEGGSTMNYRVDSDIAALSSSPPMGSVPVGDAAVLDIAANAAGLEPDAYHGELHIVDLDDPDTSEADDPVKLLTLPVTLVVLPPPDEEN